MRSVFRNLAMFLLILGIVPFSTGCATIIGGEHQTFNISSVPSGATVKIVKRDTQQEAFTVTTPCSVELKRGRGYFTKQSYDMKVTKEGYAPVDVPLTTKLNGWYIGNLGFGGLIGFLLLDPLTGGMWTITPWDSPIVLPAQRAAIEKSGDNGIAVFLEGQQTPTTGG